MRIIKIIEESLDVVPTEITFGEPMLYLVKKHFDRRCRAGSYVVSVNKILHQSPCMINQFGSPTRGTIHFRFEATCDVYFPGEVIVGCVILNIDSKKVLCSRGNISALVADAPEYAAMKPGEMVIIRVAGSRFPINTESVSLTGSMFKFANRTIVYKIIPEDCRGLCAVEVETLAYAYGELEKLDNTMVDRFTRMFQLGADPSVTGKRILLPDLLEHQPEYLIYDAGTPLADATFAVGTADDYVGLERSDRNYERICVEISASRLITAAAQLTISNINMLCDCVRLFPVEVAKQHVTLWKIISALRAKATM